jgi:mono/diheme cytochrome c family protein
MKWKHKPRSAVRCPRFAVRRSRFAALVALSLVAAAGCRQDMHNQPKYKPLRASAFFDNGSSARPLIEGTVARGTLQEDTAFFTGRVGAQLVVEMPFPVTLEVVDRGEERYNIYCAPCHDKTGGGNGIVVQRGYRQPPSMHIDRLRQVEAGHFFDVMTNGFGAMPDYRSQLTPRDRWNIVAYIRALQLSQHAQRADIPGGDPTKVQPPAAGRTGADKH